MPDYYLKCSVDGCEVASRSLGMCKSHYAMFSRYGRYEKVKSGVKVFHPLYGMWNKRKQKLGNFVDEWLNFDTFLTAVGDKPEDHFLARLDETKPCGPGNWEWRKIKLRMLEGETSSQYSSRHSKLARSLDPNLARASNYKYNFDLTMEQVEAKLKAQNYVCAMCKEPETATYKDTGKIRTLALDHNHKTGQIRDFLCAKCNLFVGQVEKNRNRVFWAEEYLNRWQQQDSLSN